MADRQSPAPTIHDVARVAGVSTSTASRALGKYGRFSSATREKVVSAAAELGYRPNTLARSMITGRTNSVGIVCADIGSPFFSGVVRGITDRLSASGHSVLITNSDEDVAAERESTSLLLEKQVDGLIVSPADVADIDHLDAVSKSGKPVVLIDRLSDALPVDTVVVDDVDAMEKATSYLLELGHMRIGIIAELRIPRESNWQSLLGIDLATSRGSINASAARLLGYLRAHRSHGVTVDPALIRRTGTYDATDATASTHQLLSDGTNPTALITVDNTTTAGAFRAVREAGVRVPEELSFIGFDNLDWTVLVEPRLTVIEQPVHSIGAAAADLMTARLEGDSSPRRVEQLRTSLLLRDSVTHPPR